MKLAAVVVLVAAAVAAGCGGGDERERRAVQFPDPAHEREVDRNPFAVTCGDLARQPLNTDSQKLVLRAEFAIARDPALRSRVKQMTLNRVGRSVYWAMTEICKGRPESFRPGRPAVDAIRAGKYLVQPRPESWGRPEPWWD